MVYRLEWFGLIVLALDIWAIYKIIGGQGSTAAKAGWIAVVLLLPILGLIIWALLGPDVRKPPMYEKEPP